MTPADTPFVASGRDYTAPLVGFGTLVAFLLTIEAVIRIGWLNRFIVPPPSEIIASFGRLFTEEHILYRFFFSAGECFIARGMVTICRIAMCLLMQRSSLL